MYNSITIKSIFKNYEVNFISNPFLNLLESNKEESILIIDSKIISLFKNTDLQLALNKFNYISIDACEENKTIDFCQNVIKQLIHFNVRRNTKLIAIGGGIIQDITAFISSILFRGIDWEFYPTTLLAQCDSCIGSKSSINFDRYKNLIGTFNAPNSIYISTDFLNTLDDADIRSGIGEMLHYFLGHGLKDSQDLMSGYNQYFSDRNKILPFIEKSLKIKKAVIEVDEFDREYRHIFNYGHSFGHAIESVTQYGVSHGQAVTYGIAIANYLSYRLNLLDENKMEEIFICIKPNLPAFELSKNNIEEYIQALSRDKKNINNSLGCILLGNDGKLSKNFLDLNETFKSYLLDFEKFKTKK